MATPDISPPLHLCPSCLTCYVEPDRMVCHECENYLAAFERDRDGGTHQEEINAEP